MGNGQSLKLGASYPWLFTHNYLCPTTKSFFHLFFYKIRLFIPAFYLQNVCFRNNLCLKNGSLCHKYRLYTEGGIFTNQKNHNINPSKSVIIDAKPRN